MSKMITEERPSSGSQTTHEHKWQKAGIHDAQHDVYVCQAAGCSESKLVKKPQVEESKSQKTLLLG